MLFRMCLVLPACAVAVLLAGWVLQKLDLEILVDGVVKIGAVILVASYALLLATGAFYALKVAAADLGHYFSRRERARRKLLFAQSLRRELEQRRSSELRQIDYFHAFRRMHLLRANDNQHMRLLAKSLYRQLRAARANMPKPIYRELKRAVGASRHRRDSDALLALQKQIAVYRL